MSGRDLRGTGNPPSGVAVAGRQFLTGMFLPSLFLSPSPLSNLSALMRPRIAAFVSQSFASRQTVVARRCDRAAMKTKAKVILMRRSTGMVAAETAAGSVIVFELLGCEEVKSGEILVGNMDGLDNQEFYNETRDERFRVFVHTHGSDVGEVIESYFSELTPAATPRRPMWPLRDTAASC